MITPEFHIVIPARYQSSRLPGKPLISLAGRSLIMRVVDSAGLAGAATVTVATDNRRIFDHVHEHGGKAVMTASSHRNGTERIAAVVAGAGEEDRIIVNVQGDEPLLPPSCIRLVAETLAGAPGRGMASLCVPVSEAREYHNPHCVKVVMDSHGRALYFSRSPIPAHRGSDELPTGGHVYRHLGIYAYHRSVLEELVRLPACFTEKAESLEQLRALHAGIPIHMAVSPEIPGPGIDTPEDVERVEALLRPS